jgi:hypothetical protein
VSAAIEAVLSREAVRSDPRLVAAFEQALSSARAKPYDAGLPQALEAIRLIGQCRNGDAGRALSRLAGDPDARLRAAAAAALGQSARPGESLVVSDGEAASAATHLLRLLTSDPNADARRAAAASLGAIDGPEVNDGLRAALETERDPRVVDSVIQALRRRGAPVEDSAQCRVLSGRAWESDIAAQMLECWTRQGISHEELIQAALAGPATQRAVALAALAAPKVSTRSLTVGRASEPPRFDVSVRDQLLSAAVWTLSQGNAISGSTRDAAERAMWDLSGRTMRLAVTYADRVTPNAARFHASSALVRADAAAYTSVRRKQQAGIALALTLAMGLLAAWRAPWRRPMLLLALASAGWAFWTLQAEGVRDLPPPPLQIFSAAAIAFLAAGATTAAAALLAQRSSGTVATGARVVLTVVTAALVAGAFCAATRIAGFVPSDIEGWELIFEPIGAAILAFAAAAILVTIDALVIRRLTIRT